MSKTVVLPVGDPEYTLSVTMSDQDIFRAVNATRPIAVLVSQNDDTEDIPLELTTSYRTIANERLGLGVRVAVLSVLTGRNLDPSLPVPFGDVAGGGVALDPTGGIIEGPGGYLLNYLEDTEFDAATGFVRDATPPPPIQPSSSFYLCDTVDCLWWSNVSGWTSEFVGASVFTFASSRVMVDELNNLGLDQWDDNANRVRYAWLPA